MSAQREDVEFASEGVACRGWSTRQRACARAGEPKELAVLPADHFAPYEPPHFATASGLAVAWFQRHL